MHFPFPAYGNKLLAEALAQAVGEGLCRAVGVCNYGGEPLAELHGLLAQRGVPLASNQARALAARPVLGACPSPQGQPRSFCEPDRVWLCCTHLSCLLVLAALTHEITTFVKNCRAASRLLWLSC